MVRTLLICLLVATISFGQTNDSIKQLSQNKKIVLFGEAHSVKEKYDEIKTFIFKSLDTVSQGKKATLFLELPGSLNYALNQIKVKKDTSLFLEWFNHVYKKKDEAPSYFWTDYRDFILELLQYAENKNIKLEIKCVDRELEFRRTAFILSSFENKVGTKIDSLLDVNYIKNDSINRFFLLDYVNELTNITNDSIELEVLNQLKKALKIDCTICLERDQFMFDNFNKYYDSTDVLVFGSFGLDHVIRKPHFATINAFFLAYHKVDTIGHKSLYTLMENDFHNQVFRVGIIALNQNNKFINMKMPKDYSHIMNKEERNYIEALLVNKEVIRVYPSEHEELKNLSSHLDYVIIYGNSNFR